MPDPHFADLRLARLYDAFDADRSDLDHYVALVEQLGGRRVLDIGCGTGVLALMLADRGVEVIGVDPAGASLDVARVKAGSERVTWIEADATHLPVTEDVDVVVMTGNVAQAFLEDEEWAAVLRRAAAVLRPGGHLVFETRDPTRRAWEDWTPEATAQRIEDEVEGVVEAWQQVIGVDLPFVRFESRFEFADATQACSPSTLRFRPRAEIEQALADAWLDLVEVRGAPDRPGRELVFIARKPADDRDHQDRGWRDLARIDADRPREVPAVGRPHPHRERERVDAAAPLRLRPDRARLRPIRLPAGLPPAPDRPRRRPRRPADRRRPQSGRRRPADRGPCPLGSPRSRHQPPTSGPT